MPMMKSRDIVEVIDAILPVLPADHEAVKLLEKVRYDAMYKAPEMHWYCWRDLTLVLNVKLPDPLAPDAPEWAKKIQRIVTGQEGPKPKGGEPC